MKNENRVVKSGQSTEYNSWSHHLAAQTSHYQTQCLLGTVAFKQNQL